MRRVGAGGRLSLAGQGRRGHVENFPADLRKEMEAIARAGVEREQLVVGNTVFDIKKSFACSALQIAPERSATARFSSGATSTIPPWDTRKSTAWSRSIGLPASMRSCRSASRDWWAACRA